MQIVDCPFCEWGEGELASRRVPGGWMVYIECPACGAHGSEQFKNTYNLITDEVRDDLINQWNDISKKVYQR